MYVCMYVCTVMHVKARESEVCAKDIYIDMLWLGMYACMYVCMYVCMYGHAHEGERESEVCAKGYI